MALYTVPIAVTPGTPINVLAELTAVKAFKLLGVEITQAGTTTATDLAVAFRVCSTATTGWTTSTVTPYDITHCGAAASTTVKVWSSGTSTDGTGTAVRQYGWDLRAGLFYAPIPEPRIVVPVNDFLVLKPLIAPPASVTFYINLDIEELG